MYVTLYIIIFAIMDNTLQASYTQSYSEVFSSLNLESSSKDDCLVYKAIYVSPWKNIIAILMRKNVEFESFQVDKQVIIEVITGNILLKQNNCQHIIEPGYNFILSSKGYYLIESTEETALLLTTIV